MDNNLYPITTNEPTYWPTDRRKIPDIIDFCVVKGISGQLLKAKSCFDLSSDHSPIIITLNATVIKKEKLPTLYNSKTNWNLFRELLNEQTNCKISLKTYEEIDAAIDKFTNTVQKKKQHGTQPPLVKTLKI